MQLLAMLLTIFWSLSPLKICELFWLQRRGLVLGIYEGAASGEVKPTRSTQTYLEKKAPQLTKLIQMYA